jgi:hypothetical protein
MYGLDTFGPVVTALTPGIFAIASIILVDKFVVKYALLTAIIGKGDFLIWVAFDDPVTTTSVSSILLLSSSKLTETLPFIWITLEKILYPTALICISYDAEGILLKVKCPVESVSTEVCKSGIETVMKVNGFLVSLSVTFPDKEFCANRYCVAHNNTTVEIINFIFIRFFNGEMAAQLNCAACLRNVKNYTCGGPLLAVSAANAETKCTRPVL